MSPVAPFRFCCSDNSTSPPTAKASSDIATPQNPKSKAATAQSRKRARCFKRRTMNRLMGSQISADDHSVGFGQREDVEEGRVHGKGSCGESRLKRVSYLDFSARPIFTHLGVFLSTPPTAPQVRHPTRRRLQTRSRAAYP